jgi:hypothetical protein
MNDDTLKPERYRRFRIVYPSGTMFGSWWLIEGGGTVQQVRLEHPMAQQVEVDEESLVSTEASP